MRALALAGVYLRSMALLQVALIEVLTGDVTLDVRGDAIIDQITASGTVSLFSDGAILDRRHDDLSNIDARYAVLKAFTGIGTPDDWLETRLTRLEALSFRDDLTKIMGVHAFKMGYELLHNRSNSQAANFPSGQFLFDNMTAGLQAIFGPLLNPNNTSPGLADDHVDGNDVPFSATFPYLAAAH